MYTCNYGERYEDLCDNEEDIWVHDEDVGHYANTGDMSALGDHCWPTAHTPHTITVPTQLHTHPAQVSTTL